MRIRLQLTRHESDHIYFSGPGEIVTWELEENYQQVLRSHQNQTIWELQLN